MKPSHSLRRAERADGFTLIEVLAALVIVSLGMLGVISAVGQTASNTSYLREKTIAHWVAMNRLTQVRLQPSPPRIDKTSDEVEMAGRKWRWTMTVQQTPVESIRRIDVSVRPEEADEKSSLASVAGFYGAAVAPPGSVPVRWQGQPASPGRGSGENGGQQQPPKQQPQPPGDSPPRDDLGGEPVDTPTNEPRTEQ
ncbi:MAG TPA: type II secretion system minor pseudopilin GspI [Steroidobacter sp.]|jgi:general secretion pathway protein I|nr:type II secretion system minor pseudopilin GspI [Steroidobacter sp.]